MNGPILRHDGRELGPHFSGGGAGKLRDIAVALTDTPVDAGAIAAAAALARSQGARLDILQPLVLPTQIADAMALAPDPGLAELYSDMRKEAEERTAAIARKLAAFTVESGVQILEAPYAEPARLLAMAARWNDLSVIARPADAPYGSSTSHAYFAGLLLESGRPVLVVPGGAEVFLLPPRHAVVAWTDTREATRAVHDAIPLLADAESVEIVVVDPLPGALERIGGLGARLASHLSRHGVATTLVAEKSRGRAISHVILDRASRARAQLIVAGGYGHSRLREWAVGGTTRELFLNSPIPLFFSH